VRKQADGTVARVTERTGNVTKPASSAKHRSSNGRMTRPDSLIVETTLRKIARVSVKALVLSHVTTSCPPMEGVAPCTGPEFSRGVA
jgi:hypothetical protein